MQSRERRDAGKTWEEQGLGKSRRMAGESDVVQKVNIKGRQKRDEMHAKAKKIAGNYILYLTHTHSSRCEWQQKKKTNSNSKLKSLESLNGLDTNCTLDGLQKV